MISNEDNRDRLILETAARTEPPECGRTHKGRRVVGVKKECTYKYASTHYGQYAEPAMSVVAEVQGNPLK